MVQKIPLTFVLSFCNCLGRRNKIFLDRSKRKTQFSIETTKSLYRFSVKYCTSLFYCTVHIMVGAALLVIRVNLTWADYYICTIIREYGIIYRRPSFLAVVMIRLLRPPSCLSSVELTDWIGGGGGRWWWRSQIIRLRGSLALYNSFNTLCM